MDIFLAAMGGKCDGGDDLALKYLNYSYGSWPVFISISKNIEITRIT